MILVGERSGFWFSRSSACISQGLKPESRIRAGHPFPPMGVVSVRCGVGVPASAALGGDSAEETSCCSGLSGTVAARMSESLVSNSLGDLAVTAGSPKTRSASVPTLRMPLVGGGSGRTMVELNMGLPCIRGSTPSHCSNSLYGQGGVGVLV